MSHCLAEHCIALGCVICQSQTTEQYVSWGTKPFWWLIEYMEGHEHINKRIIAAPYLRSPVEGLIYRLTSKNTTAWCIFSFCECVKWGKYKLALACSPGKFRGWLRKKNESTSHLYNWLQQSIFMSTWQGPLEAMWIMTCLFNTKAKVAIYCFINTKPLREAIDVDEWVSKVCNFYPWQQSKSNCDSTEFWPDLNHSSSRFFRINHFS